MLAETTNRTKDCQKGLAESGLFLDKCRTNSTALAESLDSVTNDIGALNYNYSACQNNLLMSNEELDNLKISGEKNSTAYASLNDDYILLQSEYESLSLNSAIDICCSPGLSSIRWSVSGNSIICAGGRAASCP